MASGGHAVTVGHTVDATETFKHAAFRQLAHDAGFQAAVRTDRGIKWGYVQHKLADYLPGTFGQEHEERFQWVHQRGLLKQALNEILGESGWRCEMRDGSQWVFATDRANPPLARAPDS